VKLRSLSSEFIYSAPKLNLMKDFGAELAFIGRSNAGKSSLINAISQKDLARTSKTPGRTRHAVVYRLTLGDTQTAKTLTLVDLPGFGFALMSKTEAQECETLIFSYLEKRSNLRAIVLLLDIRRDLDEREQRIVALAKARGIEVFLVLTKSDKLPVSKRSPAKKKIAEGLEINVSSIHLHSIHDEKTTRELCKKIFSTFFS
jgi:GTP-binding protein